MAESPEYKPVTDIFLNDTFALARRAFLKTPQEFSPFLDEWPAWPKTEKPRLMYGHSLCMAIVDPFSSALAVRRYPTPLNPNDGERILNSMQTALQLRVLQYKDDKDGPLILTRDTRDYTPEDIPTHFYPKMTLGELTHLDTTMSESERAWLAFSLVHAAVATANPVIASALYKQEPLTESTFLYNPLFRRDTLAIYVLTIIDACMRFGAPSGSDPSRWKKQIIDAHHAACDFNNGRKSFPLDAVVPELKRPRTDE